MMAGVNVADVEGQTVVSEIHQERPIEQGPEASPTPPQYDPALEKVLFDYSQAAVDTALGRLESYGRKVQIYLIVLGAFGSALIFKHDLMKEVVALPYPALKISSGVLLLAIYIAYTLSVYFIIRTLSSGQTRRFPPLDQVCKDVEAGSVSNPGVFYRSIFKFHATNWAKNIELLDRKSRNLVRAEVALACLIVSAVLLLILLNIPPATDIIGAYIKEVKGL